MRSKSLTIIALLMSVLLIAGCTSSESTNTEEEGNNVTTVENNNESNMGSGNSDQISFKVELTLYEEEESTVIEFKARNLNSDTPNIKMTSLERGDDVIMLGSEEKGWETFKNVEDEWEWTTIINGTFPASTEWSTVWEQYYTNYFLDFYELAEESNWEESNTSSETGEIIIYDINTDPNLDDSVFANPME